MNPPVAEHIGIEELPAFTIRLLNDIERMKDSEPALRFQMVYERLQPLVMRASEVK